MYIHMYVLVVHMNIVHVWIMYDTMNGRNIRRRSDRPKACSAGCRSNTPPHTRTSMAAAVAKHLSLSLSLSFPPSPSLAPLSPPSGNERGDQCVERHVPIWDVAGQAQFACGSPRRRQDVHPRGRVSPGWPLPARNSNVSERHPCLRPLDECMEWAIVPVRDRT